jgi:hypothetical protein
LFPARQTTEEDAVTVSDTVQPTGDPPPPGEPDNLSAFVARVLNQLSLSAWLPGAFLIASLSALAWFRLRGEVTLAGAGSFVQHNWVPFVILAVPALVIATLITQAFSFEAIRALEGYWRGLGPSAWVRTLRINRQLHRKKALNRRYLAAYAAAFQRARPKLLTRNFDGVVILAWEADATHGQRPGGLSPEQRAQADEHTFEEFWDPSDDARLDRLELEMAEFPEDSRILPTKLGNILRATEDRLENSGDLEGFVMRNRQGVPSRILQHHDQFRTRLDMYCLLVFVSAIAAVASVPTLWGLPLWAQLLVPAALLITSWASYGAALTSARGYGTVLRQVDVLVSKAERSP